MRGSRGGGGGGGVDRGSGPPPPPWNLEILPKKCNFGIFFGGGGLDPLSSVTKNCHFLGPPLMKISGSAHETCTHINVLNKKFTGEKNLYIAWASFRNGTLFKPETKKKKHQQVFEHRTIADHYLLYLHKLLA